MSIDIESLGIDPLNRTDFESAVYFGHWEDRRWHRPELYGELVRDMRRAMGNTTPHHSHPDRMAAVLMTMGTAAEMMAVRRQSEPEISERIIIEDPQVLAYYLYVEVVKVAGESRELDALRARMRGDDPNETLLRQCETEARDALGRIPVPEGSERP